MLPASFAKPAACSTRAAVTRRSVLYRSASRTSASSWGSAKLAIQLSATEPPALPLAVHACGSVRLGSDWARISSAGGGVPIAQPASTTAESSNGSASGLRIRSVQLEDQVVELGTHA